MRGSADNVILIQQVLDRTGAYDFLRAEILETVEGFRKNRSQVDEIGKTFSPANRDEIDRTLLDE